MADAPPFEIPYEYAKDPINNNIIYFPEFENYQIYEGKVIPEKKNSGLIDAFRFVGNGLGSMATYLGSKYQEHDMNNKIIDGGVATLKGLATAGKFLFKLAKPVVKYASIRAVQGVGYLCKQAEFQLSDDENDDDEEEEEENKKDKKNENKTKKTKKNKKKKDENKNMEPNNSFVLLDNNNQGNSLCLKEGQYIFEPCVDYPSFESINKIQNNNFYNINQNNDINNNNQNNYMNNNMNMSPSTPINNNQIVKPDYVIPPGLDSSSHENSIIGEK